MSWIYNGNDGWDSEECAGHVEFDEQDGTFYWQVLVCESYISGGYPGTPDWHEYELGEGHAATLVDAQWRAVRCYDRAMVEQETQAWDEAQLYSTHPDAPDPEWWKVAS
jgi:hypothetical protein